LHASSLSHRTVHALTLTTVLTDCAQAAAQSALTALARAPHRPATALPLPASYVGRRPPVPPTTSCPEATVYLLKGAVPAVERRCIASGQQTLSLSLNGGVGAGLQFPLCSNGGGGVG